MLITGAMVCAQSFARPFASTKLDRLQQLCLSNFAQHSTCQQMILGWMYVVVEILYIAIGILLGTKPGQARPFVLTLKLNQTGSWSAPNAGWDESVFDKPLPCDCFDHASCEYSNGNLGCAGLLVLSLCLLQHDVSVWCYAVMAAAYVVAQTVGRRRPGYCCKGFACMLLPDNVWFASLLHYYSFSWYSILLK